MMSSHDLHIACFFDAIRTLNRKAVVTLIQLYGLDINDNSAYNEYHATPMHIAAETDDEDMIRLISSLGGKVDGKDYYGDTPLYRAMKNQQMISSRVLLELGADLYVEVEYFDRNTNTHFSQTPLDLHKKYNNGLVDDFVVPYTKEYKRMKKLQCYARVIGKMIMCYRQSVENVWKPCGAGYRLVERDFQKLLLTA